MLLALIGPALAIGEWRGVLAVAISWLALWRKYRLEERYMVRAVRQPISELSATARAGPDTNSRPTRLTLMNIPTLVSSAP